MSASPIAALGAALLFLYYAKKAWENSIASAEMEETLKGMAPQGISPMLESGYVEPAQAAIDPGNLKFNPANQPVRRTEGGEFGQVRQVRDATFSNWRFPTYPGYMDLSF